MRGILRGKAVAAVIPGIELLEALEDAEDNRAASRMEQAAKSGKARTVPLSKLPPEVGR